MKMDPVRRRLSFSSSSPPPSAPSAPSPPSPSPSNASSNMSSSRLSKEEIDEILTSPYETGYTYSESAAYRHDAPTEFMHPRLCRRIVSPSSQQQFESDPSLLNKNKDVYSRLYRSTVTYALKEFGPLKPKPRGWLRRLSTFASDFPSDVYWNAKMTIRALFFYLISLIQYVIFFAANLAVSSAGGVWELTKWIALWMFKYFVLAPILGPFYAIVKHYQKAKYAYSFSVWAYSTLQSITQWFNNLRRQMFPVTLESSVGAEVVEETEVIEVEEPVEFKPNSHFNGLIWLLTLGPIRQWLFSNASNQSSSPIGAFEPIGTRTRSHYSKYIVKRIPATEATTTTSEPVKKQKSGVIQWTKWIYAGGIPRTVYARVKDDPSKAKRYALLAFVWLPLALLMLYLFSHAWLYSTATQHQPHQQQQQIRHFPLSTVDSLCKKVASHGDYLFSTAYHKLATTFGSSFDLIVDGVHSLMAYTLKMVGLAGIFVAELIGKMGSIVGDTLQWVKNGIVNVGGVTGEKVSNSFHFIIEKNHSLLQWIYQGTSNAFNHILELNHSFLNWIYTLIKGSSGSTLSYLTNSTHSVFNTIHSSTTFITNGCHNLWVRTLQLLSFIGASIGKIPIDQRQYPSPSLQQDIKDLKLENLPDDHPIMAKIKHLIDSTLAEERRVMDEKLKQRVGEVQQEAVSHNEKLRDEYEAKISKLIGEEREIVNNGGGGGGGEEWVKELEKGMDRKLDHLISLMNSKVTEQNSKFNTELEELRKSYSVLVHQHESTTNDPNLHHLKRSQELGETAQMDQIKQLIKEYIKRYDADKTGLPDYALESSGGAVASIRCTIPYNERSRTQMIFGIPLWYSSYSPRSVIQRKGHGASAGECWAFEGQHGYLTIKLAQRINVTAVSYEHLPIQLSPDGHIKTAPKQFLVYSYQDVDDLDSRFLLGNFTYDDGGEPLQMFQMQHHDPLMTPVIELETLSNYGAMVTCLYRFRVHGNLPTPPEA